jgi:hypothetical protein
MPITGPQRRPRAGTLSWASVRECPLSEVADVSLLSDRVSVARVAHDSSGTGTLSRYQPVGTG